MKLHAVRLDGRSEEPVDAGERERGRTLVDPTARHRFLAGRAWVRGVVGRAAGVQGNRLIARFECRSCEGTDHGRPGWTVDGKTVPLAVSLSRSGGWAVAAVENAQGTRAVGIDLEQVGRFEGAQLDATVFTTAERFAIQGQDEPDRPFLRAMLWARKEAVLKAAGTGLMTDPATVEVLNQRVRVGHLDYLLEDVHPAALQLPDGFVVALAVGQTSPG